MQLFGSSGIRRIANGALFELALKVGVAVGSFHASVVVGSDTRTSSNAMKHAVISGLLAAGTKCYDTGVVPTPTLALAAKGFDAGVMITASHNPPQYNGIKLFNPDGSSFGQSQQQKIEKAVLPGSSAAVGWQEIKSSSDYGNAVESHISRILADFHNPLECRIVLDCDCGAGSVITPYLLRRLGSNLTGLNCHQSGFFPHDIEPMAANLGDLMKMTREFGANLGIAHDGDADRMMVVDDRGRFIPGDKLMVILARAAGAKKVVTTIDASMAIEEMGFEVTRTKVGDSFVSEKLRTGGDFGGEPSGSWIFPGISLCPDGIYAAAQMSNIASQQKLSLLVDNIPSYPILRGSIGSQWIAMDLLETQLMAMEPLSINNIDGIRLDFGNGWLLVRPSGTEPKIRLTAEAKSEARAHELYDSGIKIIKGCIKER
jgi:phosphoglucosamine mutase